jgi:hypothetical protein
MKDVSKLQDICTGDIVVYETLAGSFRAYLRLDPGVEAWGATKERAIAELAVVMAERGIGFNLDE